MPVAAGRDRQPLGGRQFLILTAQGAAAESVPPPRRRVRLRARNRVLLCAVFEAPKVHRVGALLAKYKVIIENCSHSTVYDRQLACILQTSGESAIRKSNRRRTQKSNKQICVRRRLARANIRDRKL